MGAKVYIYNHNEFKRLKKMFDAHVFYVENISIYVYFLLV